jgi:hypothetical protein
MVDTGAVCSVLPHRSKAQPAGPQLSGADGRPIPTWGNIRRRLSFGLRTFFVTFLLAPVYGPILGLDFLSAHGLLVDPVGRQVLDSKTLKPLSKTPTAAGTLHSKFAAALCSITPSVRSLLASFPTIVSVGKGNPLLKHKTATPSRRQAALCSPRPAAWTQTSCTRWKQSSASWRQRASSVVHIRHGCRPCTWYARRTGHGGPAVTTADSTWRRHTTSIPSPASSTSPRSCTAASSSPA